MTSSGSGSSKPDNNDSIGRYLTRSTVILVFLVCLCLYYVIPFQRLFGVKVAQSSDKEEGKGKSESSGGHHELSLGNKRYKLYEKKRLQYRKAEAFCRKVDGRLATTETLGEMTRIVTLIKKAKLVTDEIWLSVDRRTWKRHAWKDKPHPPGMNPEAFKEMGAMMMGGGKQEMCPALSLSTRSLIPAMCLRDLPFVCEFDKQDKEREAQEQEEKSRQMREEIKRMKAKEKEKSGNFKKKNQNKKQVQNQNQKGQQVKSKGTEKKGTPKPKIYGPEKQNRKKSRNEF